LGGNKWQSTLSHIARDQNADVLCLQECGTPPRSQYEPTRVWRYTREKPFDCMTFQWEPGLADLGLWNVLYMETDTAGHRVNLAICTRSPPLRFLYARGDPGEGARPAIGLVAEDAPNRAIWTVHASAKGGNNAHSLVHGVHTASEGMPWAALGDYNMRPDKLADKTLHLYRVYAVMDPPTHQSGRTLDYMVVDPGFPHPPPGKVLSAYFDSDHFPVIFELPD
jgi:hypothetical protein